LVVTVAAVFVQRPAVVRLAGVVDLVFAVVAVSTVVTTERLSRRGA
jgi:hypothetical protein